MGNNLTQEEIEYRRYLRRRIRQRKKRQRVIIARIVVAVVFILLVVALVFGIGAIVKSVSKGDGVRSSEEVKAVVKPTPTPFTVDVPKGYERIYYGIAALRKEYPQVDDILMNLSEYPKDILQLFINNHETLAFVTGYPKHKNDTKEVSGVTKEEVKAGIPLFNQWDERWGYIKYGGGIIAVTGCGPTCMSMVYSGLKKKTDMSPADMAKFCNDNNYYSKDQGTSWQLMSEGAETLGLEVKKLSITKDTIKKELREGHPVICSMAPGDFTAEGHFIVMTGIAEDGGVIINDPNSIERSSKSWKLKNILKQIKAAWSYA